ncbi:uncharacterized protein LOC144113362 isoform X2 [Amblyomma americanum]
MLLLCFRQSRLCDSKIAAISNRLVLRDGVTRSPVVALLLYRLPVFYRTAVHTGNGRYRDGSHLKPLARLTYCCIVLYDKEEKGVVTALVTIVAAYILLYYKCSVASETVEA